MTYEEIIETLHMRNCSATAAALDYAAREEACKLLDNGNSWGSYKNQHHRALRIANEKATEAAREFYAEDITAQLKEPRLLTPETVLNHRRVAIAWAVAEVLRTNSDKSWLDKITEGGTKIV
jgi:hypothetical protein